MVVMRVKVPRRRAHARGPPTAAQFMGLGGFEACDLIELLAGARMG